jgi:hypothetical protein
LLNRNLRLPAIGSAARSTTLVATPEGSRPVEEIRAGDMVWAYDLVSSRWLPRTVLETFSRQHAGRFATIQVAGEAITSTYHHPYWVVSGEDLDERPSPEHVPDVPENASTPGRWVDAGDLRPGDLLLLSDGRRVPVTAVEVQLWTQPVYNFSVDDLHTYAVGKHHALVHNNCAEDFISIEEFVETSRRAKARRTAVSGRSAEDAVSEVIVGQGLPDAIWSGSFGNVPTINVDGTPAIVMRCMTYVTGIRAPLVLPANQLNIM